MGCLTRVGCLAVAFTAGAVGYYLYGDQLPSRLGRVAGRAAERVSGTSVADRDRDIAWVSLRAGASSASAQVISLSKPSGPAFVTLSASELAGMLGAGLMRYLPESQMAPQVAVRGDRILLRAEVNLRQFAGEGAFGSVIGATLSGRDSLRMSGTLTSVRPGLAQYRVRELQIKGVDVPPRVIPGLVGAMRRRARSDSLLPDALPVTLPRYVGDVRVANDRVTLYKVP